MQGAEDVRDFHATVSTYIAATPPIGLGAEGLTCPQRMVIGMDDVWGIIPVKRILEAFPFMISRYCSVALDVINFFSSLPAGLLCAITVSIFIGALAVFAAIRCRRIEVNSTAGKRLIRGVECLVGLLLSPLLLSALASATAVLLICLAFPVLAKAGIGHIDYSIFFCLGQAGFSRFVLVPYLVKSVNGLWSVWRDPARAEEAESHAHKFKLLCWAMPFTNSAVWTVLKCWDAMTHWATYSFQPTCPAAEFNSVLPFNLTHVLLATSIMSTISVFWLISIMYLDMSPETLQFAVLYHWFFELLLQDIPQASTLFLVTTSCPGLNQYAYYSLANSTVGCICAVTAIVRRCYAPPGASYEPLQLEGCVERLPKYVDPLQAPCPPLACQPLDLDEMERFGCMERDTTRLSENEWP